MAAKFTETMFKAVEYVTESEDGGDYHIHRRYSGRGMYGRECVGVTIPYGDSTMKNFLTVAFAAVLAAADHTDDDVDFGTLGHEANTLPLMEVMSTLASMDVREDSMGRGTIVYFPSIEYVGTDDDSEEDY